MTGAHDRQKTLPTPATVHVVRVDPQRLVHAPHPHLPPLRRRRRLLALRRLPHVGGGGGHAAQFLNRTHRFYSIAYTEHRAGVLRLMSPLTAANRPPSDNVTPP